MRKIAYEILMDKNENERKCTIAPNKGRPDFRVRYFTGNKPIEPFTSTHLLHMHGVDIRELKERPDVVSVAAIDCNWKKVPPLLGRIPAPLPVLVRLPSECVTAYPRANKEGKDPAGGLATIEALFIAAACFGFWDETLLDKYHFKNQFLEMNADFFRTLRLNA